LIKYAAAHDLPTPAYRPNVKGATQPALGHALRYPGSLSTAPCTTPPLPPSPLLPPTVARPPYPIVENIKIDLDKLRSDGREAIRTVEEAWGLGGTETAEVLRSDAHGSPNQVDILELLKASIDAVRSVRAYSMALPTAMLPSCGPTTQSTLRIPSGQGRMRQSLSTPSRPAPRSVSSSGSMQSGSMPAVDEDPLSEVRKAALEVLTGLRALEERSRVVDSTALSMQPENTLTETGPPTQSRTSQGDDEPENSRLAPRTRDFEDQPRVTVSVDESEEEEDLSFFFPTESEDQTGVVKDSWYNRLNDADRQGWLYRTDMTIDPDLLEERRLVKTWLQAVDRRIFGHGNGSRGSNVDPRRNSNSSDHGLELATEGLTWLDPERNPDPLGE
jgi:hypothetical protein